MRKTFQETAEVKTPIKTGDTVFKKSGRPFTSGFYFETVSGLRENPDHPDRKMAVFFSDGNICPLNQVEKYIPPTATRLKSAIFAPDFKSFLKNAKIRMKHVVLEPENGEKYECLGMCKRGSLHVDSTEKLYAVMIGIYRKYPDTECYISHNHLISDDFQIKWGIPPNDSVFLEDTFFEDNFRIKPEYAGWETGLAYGV